MIREEGGFSLYCNLHFIVNKNPINGKLLTLLIDFIILYHRRGRYIFPRYDPQNRRTWRESVGVWPSPDSFDLIRFLPIFAQSFGYCLQLAHRVQPGRATPRRPIAAKTTAADLQASLIIMTSWTVNSQEKPVIMMHFFRRCAAS